MFYSLAEPNRTKSYKLERVLFKTLECFPKIWNSIELELKETKSAKSFKRKVAKIYLDPVRTIRGKCTLSRDVCI